MYTCIDAFSGAGGLSLGLQDAGLKVIFSFDNDPKCIETHKKNRGNFFGHEAHLASVESMLNGNLLRLTGLKKGELFLLAGGPPCQGFSIQRRGCDDDKRNELVYKFMSLVGEVMPEYFLMENVRGIMGRRGQAILSKFKQTAQDFGYKVTMEVLDAQDYGVPQRRERVFIVGEKALGQTDTYKFPPPTTPVGQRITVRKAIGHLPEPPLDGSDHPDYAHHRRDRLSELNIQRLKALQPGQGMEHLPKHLLAKCHRVGADVIGHRNVYGRMAWDDVAPTLTARFDSFTRGKFGHPEQTRSISLREGALIQTFPTDFVFSGTKVEIARQIGNAVPPKLGYMLGKSIIEHKKTKETEVIL